MDYEEQSSKRSRVVVNTPTSRREMVESEEVRTPERGGISGATVGVIVVLAVALVTILVLMLLSGQTTESNELAAQPTPLPQTTIIQQPAAQPPVVIQQPAPVTQPPIVITPGPSGGSTSSVDATIQTQIDKLFADDSSLAGLPVIATVVDGKVTLVGSVKDQTQKDLVERSIRRLKGVIAVDNQISIAP
jgi:hypothetical protein